jgi:PAS domain S-box-containing protein
MCNPTQCRYLAQSSHFVATCDSGGRLRGIEPGGAAALGYSPADLAGKPLADLVPAPLRPHLARTLARCDAGQCVWDEVVIAAADGRHIPMRCCFQRLIAPNERPGLLVTGTRHDAGESGVRAQVAAALGQLAFRCHGPAHRLMQALEAILMQYPWSDAAVLCRQELDALLDAVSQSVAGPPQHLNSHAVDVVQVLEAALRLADGEPEFKGLAVGMRPERAGIRASAHPAGLVLLALHLVRSARDATYGSKSPKLLIDVYRQEDRVVLEFADNGAGRGRDDTGIALSPLFQMNSDGRKQEGLGLVTCSELVHHMGGTMRILNRPAKGTTVVVTLQAEAAK